MLCCDFRLVSFGYGEAHQMMSVSGRLHAKMETVLLVSLPDLLSGAEIVSDDGVF